MEGKILEEETTADHSPANEQIANIKSKRKYDIIVFGASGFTGQYVVMEMGRFSQTYNLTWAIAGRNTDKLQNILDKLYKTLDGYEDKKIDIIYADVQDIKTVMRMAQTTSVVINCIGPYYIFGEVVVKSCVLTSTHYVDITGEPLFMEKMAYIYNRQAEENHSLIINALGMTSVPTDLGVEFLYKHFSGELKNVDVYMEIYPSSFIYALPFSTFIHDCTWISTILHLATEKQRLYYRNLLDELMGITRVKPNVSKILHRRQTSMQSDDKEWCLAFPEPDQAVVTRSIHHAKTIDNLPYNFDVRNYFVFGDLISALIGLILYVTLSILAKVEQIRILFVRFPRFFSLGVASNTGPNEKKMENSHMSLTLIGRGTTSANPPNDNLKEIAHKDNIAARTTIIKVRAKNPGYGFTSKAVILGAITIIKDHINIPKGGVLTPASAFRNTQFMNRLMDHDAAVFEIESDLIIYGQQSKLV
ncbi:saccharopine dehydrogenase-like oxidoreductase [Acyrthosiphon pisum]|uniref:Saccharopine dehydrogenase NADP binding domain-containing protein n=1 Tax=Acyrthosiphon pisum TaxID=7029 RepID=A0A8R1X1A0_ACYPI|nr:saccharopine dehydrogenase-like oxidoreductase [Acyrthosiphon pisum]|eukprot:XP_008179776.1 PREDICTED: saccharopine dehydrogenase-like oxidoreductase [Acyrthosiphon pisum]